MRLLENRVAIVTGATKAKGLGKAIAVNPSEQGAQVALTGRAGSKEGVEANVAEIKADGGEAMVVLVDVSDSSPRSRGCEERGCTDGPRPDHGATARPQILRNPFTTIEISHETS